MTSLCHAWWKEVRGPDISAWSRQEALTGLLAEQGSAASSIKEEVLAFRHILDVNLGAAIHSRKDTGGEKTMSVGPIGDGMSWLLAGAGEPGGGGWVGCVFSTLTLQASGAAGSTAS